MTCSALRLDLTIPEILVGRTPLLRWPLEGVFRYAHMLAGEPVQSDGGCRYPLAVEDVKTVSVPLPLSRPIDIELLHEDGALGVMLPNIPGLLSFLRPALEPWMIRAPELTPDGVAVLLRPRPGGRISVSLGSLGEISVEVPR